jgi:hypothetical protein
MIYSKMLRHPRTGKPIVVLKQENTLSKDIRTLVWCNTIEDVRAANNVRATCALSSIDVYRQAVDEMLNVFIFYSRETADIFEMFNTPKKPNIFVVSRDKVPNEFAQLIRSLGSVIILEDIANQVPYIPGIPFNLTSVSDVHIMVGMIHRASHIVSSEIRDIDEGIATHLREFGVTVSASLPNKKIWLVQQYFVPSAGRRAKEIDATLIENMESGVFDKIILLNENDKPLSKRIMDAAEKCTLDIRNISRRLTYGDVLRLAASDETAPYDDVYIVAANADILFNKDTWKELHCVSLKDSAFAILRHEFSKDDVTAPPKLFGFPTPSDESTDAWVVTSNTIKRLGIVEKADAIKRMDSIPFGFIGSDQIFVGELMRNRLKVYNPCTFFQIYHNHKSNVVTHTKLLVDCNVFGQARGCGLLEIHFDTDTVRTSPIKSIENAPVYVTLRSDNMKSVETFCTMIERNSRYLWKHDVDNTITIPKIPVYEWNKCTINSQGQLQFYDRVLAGSTKESIEITETSGIATLQITKHIEKLFNVPFKIEVMNSFSRYFTYYLSRIARLMTEFPDYNGCFFAHPMLISWLNYFVWPCNYTDINLIPWSKQMYFYADNCIGTFAGPWLTEVSKEDIRSLRKALVRYSTLVTRSDCFTIILGGFINSAWAETFSELLKKKGYSPIVIDPTTASPTEMFDAFCGVGHAIVSGGGAESGKAAVDYSSRTFWSWLMPASAKLYEIQNEFNPDPEVAAVCAAADVEHNFIIIHRAPSEVQMKYVAERLEKIVPSCEDIISDSSNITNMTFAI